MSGGPERPRAGASARVHPEVFRALGALCEPPDAAHRAVASGLDLDGWPQPESDSGLFTTLLPPYAAIYLGPEGMLGGEAAARIAGFWHALGYEVPAEPDHLAALLGLYAALVQAEQDQQERAETAEDLARVLLHRQARTALLTEHLVTWVPAYAAAVAAVGEVHHVDWAALLTEVLLGEAAELDHEPSPSAHLRTVPGLPDLDSADQDGVDILVRALLTPARSGIVLTRTDLLRCARTLGLGMRIGERAFVLHRLLEADAVGVLGFVETEARTWAERHRQLVELLGDAARHWLDRAESTAEAARHRSSRLQEVLADVR